MVSFRGSRVIFSTEKGIAENVLAELFAFRPVFRGEGSTGVRVETVVFRVCLAGTLGPPICGGR